MEELNVENTLSILKNTNNKCLDTLEELTKEKEPSIINDEDDEISFESPSISRNTTNLVESRELSKEEEELEELRLIQKKILTKKANECFSGFIPQLVGDKKIYRSIKESFFVNRFLPYILFKKEISKKKNFTPEELAEIEFKQQFFEPIVQEYLSQAGSFFEEVNVISDTTGKVLFTLPPLLGSLNFNAKQYNPDKMRNDAINIDKMNEMIPGSGDPALNVLTKNIDNNTSGVIYDYPTRWKEIFNRYSSKPVMEEKVEEEIEEKIEKINEPVKDLPFGDGNDWGYDDD